MTPLSHVTCCLELFQAPLAVSEAQCSHMVSVGSGMDPICVLAAKHGRRSDWPECPLRKRAASVAPPAAVFAGAAEMRAGSLS